MQQASFSSPLLGEVTALPESLPDEVQLMCPLDCAGMGVLLSRDAPASAWLTAWFPAVSTPTKSRNRSLQRCSLTMSCLLQTTRKLTMIEPQNDVCVAQGATAPQMQRGSSASRVRLWKTLQHHAACSLHVHGTPWAGAGMAVACRPGFSCDCSSMDPQAAAASPTSNHMTVQPDR